MCWFFLMQLIIREIHYYLKISSKCSILKILTRCIPISDFNRNVRGKFRNGIGTPQSEINTFVIWSKLQKRAYHQFRFTKRCTVRWKAEMAKKINAFEMTWIWALCCLVCSAELFKKIFFVGRFFHFRSNMRINIIFYKYLDSF